MSDLELPFDLKYYEFLDELRESGVTNMFGAGVYLVNEFHISRKESHEILNNWMAAFSERHPEVGRRKA